MNESTITCTVETEVCVKESAFFESESDFLIYFRILSKHLLDQFRLSMELKMTKSFVSIL